MKRKILKLTILLIILIVLSFFQEVIALPNPSDAKNNFKVTYGDLYDEVNAACDLDSYYAFLGQAQGGGKTAFNASEYTTNTKVYCAKYGDDYPYQVQRDEDAFKLVMDEKKAAYEKAKNDGQPSGMPSSSYEQLLKNKQLEYFIAHANWVIAKDMKEALMYDMKPINVDTSTETDSKKCALAYAFAHNAGNGKRAYASVEEYIADNEGAGDENQRTVWSICGFGTYNTEEATKAKAYAKDISTLQKGTQTINVNGKIENGTVISDDFTSPIDFSADYIKSKNISGGSLNNPSSFDSIKKDTSMSVKTTAEEGKTEYTVEITVKYETYSGSYIFYENGVMFSDGSRTELQDLIKLVGFTPGEGEFKLIIIITVDEEPGELIIKKKWSGSGLPNSELPDVNITVTGPNGYSESFSLGPNEQKKLEDLKPGEYTVQEQSGVASIEYDGVEYTFTYDTSEHTAKPGNTVTITNSYEGEEPPPSPTPTPGEGEEGEEKAEIKKTVEYVLSKYEGDTSKSGVGGAPGDVVSEDLAHVQRGDEVVFKIEVSAKKDKIVDEPRAATQDEIAESGFESDTDYKVVDQDVYRNEYCTTEYCNAWSYQYSCLAGYDSFRRPIIRCNGHRKTHTRTVEYGEKVIYENHEVTETHLFGVESFTVTDQLLGTNKLKIKGIFSESNSKYASDAGVTPPESTGWKESGGTYTWTAEEAGSEIVYDAETTSTFYIICDVLEEWKDYDDEETNKATLTEVKFAEKIEKNLKADKKIEKAKRTKYSCYKHNGTSWSYTGTTDEGEVDADLEPEEGEGKTITPNKSDEAKAKLQGYDPEMEKVTSGVAAIILEANNPKITDYSYFEWGDIVEYKITVKNKGQKYKTNFYDTLFVNDALEQGIEYVSPSDSRYSEYKGYLSGTQYNEWNDSSGGSRQSDHSGTNKYQDLSIGTKGEGLLIGETEETIIVVEVIEEPGGNTINYTQLLGFMNRNGVEISTEDFDPYPEDTVETPVETYEVGVSKNITEIKSAGLSCEEEKTNEVASEKGNGDSKNGIADRGDLIKFTIEVENKSSKTNLWKVKLKDTFDPGLEYIRCSEGDWVVEPGQNEIIITYMSTGTDPKNDDDWGKIEPGGKVSIDLYFQIVDGAEFSKRGMVYNNTVSIEQVWNRNAKELEEEHITNSPKEDSASIQVRQISASIDKYVSGLFGGIEGDVSSTIVNASRERKSETRGGYNSSEEDKERYPVEVERGDEITYTIVVKNTQPFDNSGGLISAMKMVDTYDEGLIFSRIASGPVNLINNDTGSRKLELEYTGGHLLPEKSFEFTLVFIMTEEPSDISNLYEKVYTNTIQITELKNVNDWTWSLEGAMNAHNDSCEYSGPCSLSSLQNEGGIRADMPSSDHVYMLAYAVELEKYIVNVEHTLDNGDVENYNKDNQWASQNDAMIDRENMNDIKEYDKTKYKETYPVQVEKGDIVTYEIKVKNTYNNHNGGLLIDGTTLQPSIYKIDIADVFSSEDDTEIAKNDVGLKFIEAKAEKGGEVKFNKTNDRGYMFEFTPQRQCDNAGKNTDGYGIGSGEYATFTVTVEVTRSNMYLYELINRASIQDVYNRNNNIGTSKYESPEERTDVEYKVTNGNRLYKYEDGSIVAPITVKDPWDNEYETSVFVTDADYINLKDLIISGYVWDDTDVKNEEDGLMTWSSNEANTSTDRQVEGDVYVYLYRIEPGGSEGQQVMKTKVDSTGYYIFGTPNENTDVSKELNVLVNQKYRFEPIYYKTPEIKVNNKTTKTSQTKRIYGDPDVHEGETEFINYRIVKAPNKDYNSEERTTRYWINEYKGYYQYYVEFEYNGMKYTHTVYASNSELDGDKGNKGNENNQDGQYNLNTNGRATKLSESWLPWRTSTKDNSEYYEIDSNSAEFKSVREAFNNKFATIEYNNGLDVNDKPTELSYTKDGHVSTLNYTENLYIRARSFVTNWIDKTGNSVATNPSDTNTLFFWDSNNTTRTPRYTNTVGTTEETEYLKYINLGLKQRPTLDLELTKDVYDVQVDINEKTMVYDYSSETIDRGPLARKPDDGEEYSYDKYIYDEENGNYVLNKNYVLSDNDQTHVYYYKNAQGYQKTGYQLKLYKSDWLYRYTDYANIAVEDYKKGIKVANSEHNYDAEASMSELNVQITYKYTITNRSAYLDDNKGETIIGAVKEIVDYYQSDLIPNSVGTYVINRGSDYNGKQTDEEKRNESGYVLVGDTSKYTNINGNTKKATSGDLGAFKTCYIYSVGNYEKTTIASNDYTNVIGAAGHSEDFELEDERLYPGDSVDIYLTFTVSRNALENRTLDLDNKTKYNVAEINAFSSYYSKNPEFETNWNKDLDTPGLVDKDSNPGNIEITKLDDISIYEDDTFKVDITTTLDHDARLIDGIVWEDVNYGSKGTAIGNTITQTQQIVGDGKYYAFRNNNDKIEDFDNLIGGIKVELIELITVRDGDTATVYEDRANVKDLIDGEDQNIFDTESGKDGYYDIKGFIPGNYIVRFTYGNGTTKEKAYTTYQYEKNKDGEIVLHHQNDNNDYNGQDYKSTQYQVGITDNETDDNYITNVWHDMISDSVNKVDKGIHISDARDDEVRRLEVIAYSRTINNEVAEILNTKDLKDATFTDNTYMFADTAKLQIELEHLKYVESDGFENANGENNKDAKYNEVAIYHGKVDEGNNKGKFVVGTYYKIDAFGNRIPDKAYDENLNLNGNDEPNQHKIKYYDLNNNLTEGGLSQQLANYTHWVADIDFGMEQRPTTNISLHKMISGIKVTTADGEAIVEVEYEPTYDKNGAIATNIITGAEHIQHVANTANYSNSDDNPYNGVTKDIDEEVINKIPNIVKFISEKLIKNKQGFYYINIDEDLMQGAVVTVDYSISVTNESEVDTLGLLTGFKNGEQIYDETFAILANDKDISTYTPNGIKLSEKYNYVETRANNNIPTYKGGKLSITNDENNIDINNIKYGYYLGSTYYSGKYHEDTYVVETRVDQIIDYIDNDLTFREEDNSTENATWRTVSLAELVEGEIQKDVVGQDNDNNYYSKTKTVNYVPYNRANNTDKTIEVSNVGNMLADSVYRIRNLNATKKENGKTTTSNIESAIYYANVQGDVIKDGDEVYDVIKDTNGNITYKRRVTIMDDDAREYVTDQKKNIVLSVPEEEKNPDMYTYLIPEKALDGTILEGKFENDTIEDIINGYITDHQEERINDNTKKAAINIWNEFRTYNKKSPITFKWFKNFTNIILNDDTITEIYNDDYKRAGRELLIQIVKEKYMIMQDAAKGTYNGENSEYKNDTVTYVRSNTQSSARINLKTTRTISPDTDTEDLSFENIAEIIQFSNESGRRDEYATVGDASIWKGAWKAATPPEDETDRSGETALVPKKENDEDGELSQYNRDKNNPKGYKIFTYDTDTTEVILLSPPTGVSQSQLVKIETQETIASIAVIVGSTIVVISLGIVLFRKATKKKFYK